MAQKKQALNAKLGSWADQASLTRSRPQRPNPEGTAPSAEARRAAYQMTRGLIDRIADTAAQHGLSHNELVGYLLTWSLDQIDSGAHEMPAPDVLRNITTGPHSSDIRP